MPFDTGFKLPILPTNAPSEMVYLFQYSTWGHHSLGFYRNGQLIEFTYGDWALFALNKRDFATAFIHMAFPTLGALGRKSVSWSPSEAAIPKFTDCINLVPFPAEAALVDNLYSRLNSEFESSIADQVYHDDDDLYFVPYHIPYSLLNNCNHELAKWLVELQGEVSGRVFWNPDFIQGMSPKLPSIA